MFEFEPSNTHTHTHTLITERLTKMAASQRRGGERGKHTLKQINLIKYQIGNQEKGFISRVIWTLILLYFWAGSILRRKRATKKF